MTLASQTLPDGLLVAWLGDDFTGSAATMEVLSFAGLPSVLFPDIPTQEQLARFSGMRGIGIATTARAQTPQWMEEQLPRRFAWIAELGARLVHYKACSTLDSSPRLGSIGKAVEMALAKLPSAWVPMLFAAPAIRRYQVFGNLFAAGGEDVYRLDRHPSMARHPATPMDEADVCRHLGRQTNLAMATLDAEALESDAEAALAKHREKGAKLIALDTVTEGHLRRCGDLMWSKAGDGLLAVGSQGVEYALVAAWQTAGAIPTAPANQSVGSVERIIVVSGSASLVTAEQIAWGKHNGFSPIPLDAADLVLNGQTAEADAIESALRELDNGKDPILLTACGPDDPAIAECHARLAAAGIAANEAQTRIGQALGHILGQVLERSGLRRAIVAGGDTSGHAMKALDVYAFTALAPTIPGAALLQVHSEAPALDGLQVALKGGQMGTNDFFGWIKAGGGDRGADRKGTQS